MEDIFQILIIVGFIVFAIFRQLTKKVTENSQDVPHYPEYKEGMSEDEVLVTPPFLTTELKSVALKHKKETFPSKKTHIRNQEPILKENTSMEETLSAEDFHTNSVDEVRKAVIWSEILNRKY